MTKEELSGDLTTAYLTAQALEMVSKLKNVATSHEREYPREIQAVLVFSGPGTYYDRLKQGQAERQRWMDRDRIRAGVAVTNEIAQAAKTYIENKRITATQITKRDMEQFGPFLVYNGIPIENKVFSEAIESPYCQIPKSKIIIIPEVKEADGNTHPIRHTGDQVLSFYQAVENSSSPLYAITNVALVAHIPDFIRIPFYTEFYDQKHRALGFPGLNFWPYALRSRPATEAEHQQNELERLVKYAAAGQLAQTPSTLLFHS